MSRRQRQQLNLSIVFFTGLVLVGALVAVRPGNAESDAELMQLEGASGDTSKENLEELFGDSEASAQPASDAAGEPAQTAAAPSDFVSPEPTSDDPSLDGELEQFNRSVSTGAPTAVVDDGTTNQVTNLEFKHDSKGSRVVVSSLKKLKFTETKSPGARQYIYLFENTDTPEKFQRAYDTTEFSSPVALFTLFQLPGTGSPTSKLIVQLREDQVPSVVDSDRGLILEFGASKNTDPVIEDPAKREVLSGDNIYAKGGAYTGEIIQRLEIKQSDLQDVLRLIARTSGYNIVIGQEVTGKVGTLSLTNIPWDQAFTLVLQMHKLGFVREGNVLRVGTTAALRSEREEAASVAKAQEAVEPLKTVLLPISYAKAADLAPKAKTFLSSRGDVQVDTRTNTVIIKDVEAIVSRVQRLLQALDTQPPRVSVSAKIVEMRSSMTRSIGVNLGNSLNFGGTSITLANAPISGGGSFSGTLNAPQFAALDARLQLGELDNRIKLLANPQVSVVANQTGTVTQSVAFFVPTVTVANGIPTTGLSQITSALNLNVTPIVSGDGSIFMNVDITNDIPSISGAATTVASRSVRTQVLVENGDTAVIGGVFQNTINTDKSGIPFLMRIPLLGYLFSNNTIQDNRTEIFIFLTAKIMNAEESFKRTL